MSTIESTHPLTTDATAASASGQAKGASAASPPAAIEGFDRWVKGYQKYESVLVRSHPGFLLPENRSSLQGDMAKASTDSKFKGELDAIVNCESLS